MEVAAVGPRRAEGAHFSTVAEESRHFIGREVDGKNHGGLAFADIELELHDGIAHVAVFGAGGVVDYNYIGKAEVERARAGERTFFREVFLAVGLHAYVVAALVLDYVDAVLAVGVGSGRIAHVVAVGAVEGYHGALYGIAEVGHLTLHGRGLDYKREVDYRQLAAVPGIALKGRLGVVGMVVGRQRAGALETEVAEVIHSIEMRHHQSK